MLISDLLLQQLNGRREQFPINWTDAELARATWLAPRRLLFFIYIINPNDQ